MGRKNKHEGGGFALVESQGQFEAFPNGHKHFWVKAARLKVKQDALDTMQDFGFGVDADSTEDPSSSFSWQRRQEERHARQVYDKQWERFLSQNEEGPGLPPCPPRIKAAGPVPETGVGSEPEAGLTDSPPLLPSVRQKHANVLLHLPLGAGDIWGRKGTQSGQRYNHTLPNTRSADTVGGWAGLVSTLGDTGSGEGQAGQAEWPLDACAAPSQVRGSATATLRLRAFADTVVDVVRGQALSLKVVPRQAGPITGEYAARTAALQTVRLLVEEVYYGTQQYANALTGGKFVQDVDQPSLATKNAHVVCRILR